jgi:hypothetical protein
MRAKTSLAAASLTGVLLLGQTLAGNLTTAAGYQGSVARNSQDDITPRGLYISKSADAMRVKVLDARTGAAVSPSREFTSDDTLKVIIESNFESYAYIVNVEIVKNSNRRFLLYPNPRTVNNRINRDEPLELSVAFDKEPATEVLQVIVSHDRIDYLDAALKGKCSESENRCLLDTQAAARVASIVGDGKSSRETEPAGIFPRQSEQKQNQSGFRSRDIILAPGKDKDEKETYVAIPIKTGGDGRLKSKEVVVFEMRLKHV